LEAPVETKAVPEADLAGMANRQGSHGLQRGLTRFLAACLLAALVGYLVWGAGWQRPRDDPWAQVGFWTSTWWLTPRPDDLYRELPLTVGEAGAFVPSDLCQRERLAAGLGLACQDTHNLRLVGAEANGLVLKKLRLMPEARRAVGITLADIPFERRQDQTWAPLIPGLATLDAGRTVKRLVLGNDNSVRGAAFSPDGKLVVTTSEDTARVWDAAAGKLIGSSWQHSGGVNSVAFSPDGARVVSAFGDNTARVWDAATGARIGQPLRHDGLIFSAVFSPDGKRVLTASEDYSARVWDAATGAPIGQPLRHGDKVISAVFSPDGKRVVTASLDKSARVWDAATGAPIGQSLRHEGGVRSAAFSPDGARIVTSSGRATIWELGQESPRFTDLVLAKDGSGWAVGRSGWAARLSQDSSLIVVPTQTDVDLEAIAETPDGRALAVGDHGAVFLLKPVERAAAQQNKPLTKAGAQQNKPPFPDVVQQLPTDKSPPETKLRHLYAIVFTGEDGWIGGSHGWMMHSANGGESWGLQSATTQGDIRGLYIQPSERVGWAFARTPQGAGWPCVPPMLQGVHGWRCRNTWRRRGIWLQACCCR
jgi:hypothetical protein